MFWEIYQQSRIHDANMTASSAVSKAQNAGYAIRELEDKVDSLALTCQALWEILRERTSLTEEELEALTQCVRRGKPYGTDRWRSNTAVRLGLEHSLRPRGRPKRMKR